MALQYRVENNNTDAIPWGGPGIQQGHRGQPQTHKWTSEGRPGQTKTGRRQTRGRTCTHTWGPVFLHPSTPYTSTPTLVLWNGSDTADNALMSQ